MSHASPRTIRWLPLPVVLLFGAAALGCASPPTGDCYHLERQELTPGVTEADCEESGGVWSAPEGSIVGPR